MQACGRCGNCALVFGVNGLVARVVVGIGGAFDIGGQRQLAVPFQKFVYVLAA